MKEQKAAAPASELLSFPVLWCFGHCCYEDGFTLNQKAMMKPLRKRHLIVWSMLAILLPAGILIAWLSVPQQIPQTLLQPEPFTALPVVLKKADKENYSVAIRSNEKRSAFQLEWINKSVLQFPTATIYAADKVVKNIIEAKLAGRIEARGDWYFAIDSIVSSYNHLIVYDFIQQQIIDTINLEP